MRQYAKPHRGILLFMRAAWLCTAIAVALGAGCAADTEAEDAIHWHPGGAAQDICITTQYTKNIEPYAKVAISNHIAYASQHGYTHVAYRGRPAPDFRDPEAGDERHSRGGGFYWQKIGAVRETLAGRNKDGTPVCRWVMWVDADMAFTNFASRIELIIEALAPHPDIDIIVTREQAMVKRVQLNSGAFFVKNSAGGNAFITDIAQSFPHYKNDKYPEQDAITDYVANHDMHREGPLSTWRSVRVRDNVALVSQRAFNAFAGRFDRYTPEAQWRPCDFIAHLTGASTQERAVRILNMTTAARHCTAQAPFYQDVSL